MRKRFAILFGLLLSVTYTPVFAALPAVIGTTLTEIQTDALAAIDLVWPVLLAVLGGFVLIKIVKRASNKI